MQLVRQWAEADYVVLGFLGQNYVVRSQFMIFFLILSIIYDLLKTILKVSFLYISIITFTWNLFIILNSIITKNEWKKVKLASMYSIYTFFKGG